MLEQEMAQLPLKLPTEFHISSHYYAKPTTIINNNENNIIPSRCNSLVLPPCTSPSPSPSPAAADNKKTRRRRRFRGSHWLPPLCGVGVGVGVGVSNPRRRSMSTTSVTTKRTSISECFYTTTTTRGGGGGGGGGRSSVTTPRPASTISISQIKGRRSGSFNTTRSSSSSMALQDVVLQLITSTDPNINTAAAAATATEIMLPPPPPPCSSSSSSSSIVNSLHDEDFNIAPIHSQNISNNHIELALQQSNVLLIQLADDDTDMDLEKNTNNRDDDDHDMDHTEKKSIISNGDYSNPDVVSPKVLKPPSVGSSSTIGIISNGHEGQVMINQEIPQQDQSINMEESNRGQIENALINITDMEESSSRVSNGGAGGVGTDHMEIDEHPAHVAKKKKKKKKKEESCGELSKKKEEFGGLDFLKAYGINGQENNILVDYMTIINSESSNYLDKELDVIITPPPPPAPGGLGTISRLFGAKKLKESAKRGLQVLFNPYKKTKKKKKKVISSIMDDQGGCSDDTLWWSKPILRGNKCRDQLSFEDQFPYIYNGQASVIENEHAQPQLAYHSGCG